MKTEERIVVVSDETFFYVNDVLERRILHQCDDYESAVRLAKIERYEVAVVALKKRLDEVLESMADNDRINISLSNDPSPHACSVTFLPEGNHHPCREPGCQYEVCSGCAFYVSSGKHHPDCPVGGD